MKRKLLSVVLTIAVTAGLITGCSGKDTSGSKKQANVSKTNNDNSLIIPVASSVTSLNRLLESMKEGHLMLAAFNDELFYKDTDETRYYLAESCGISKDSLTYTVKLRDNLKWHDGTPITADDILFTMDCIKNTNNGTDFTNIAFINDKEVSVKKVDDLTVSFTLPEVSASYEALLGRLILLPKHAFKGNKDIKSSDVNLTDIGSGPYKLKEFKNGESLVLEKFKDYYAGAPSVDKIIYKVIPDTSAQEVALLNGEINFMELSSEKAAARYHSDKNLKVHTFPEGRTNYLAWNRFSSTWSDRDRVKALFAALSQKEIINGAYGEKMAEPANSIFSTQTLYYDKKTPFYEQDLSKAKKLAELTGLTDKTLKLYYNSDRAYMKETALVIQQQLKLAGITLNVEGVESNGFFDIVFGDKSDYDLYLNGYGCTGDPDETLAGMFNGTWGINVDTSQEILDLFRKGRSTLDEKQRAEIYSEIQQKAYEEYLIYPIAYPNYQFAVLKTLKGVDEIQLTPVFEDFTKLKYQ